MLKLHTTESHAYWIIAGLAALPHGLSLLAKKGLRREMLVALECINLLFSGIEMFSFSVCLRLANGE